MKTIILTAVFMAVGSLFVSTHLSAQTRITGMVKDQEGKPVEAFISVMEKGSDMISAFADADSKGHYEIEYEGKADSIVVSAGGMSFGNVTKMVANRSQTLDFIVAEEGIELKNVSVVADKIRQSGDTISYLVSSYSDQNDRTIGEVLKKMPGIEVSNSGGITYNGKSISKLYIENMDMLQSRYGLATNNINANDVASVQVLENHQSIKTLQGKVFSDDVAINLKLKESAKGTYAINAMAGAGTALSSRVNVGDRGLWTGELIGMYFAKTRQNMMLYGTNNSGDDVAEQTKSQYGEGGSVARPLMPMNIVMPSTPDIPQKRYWDNRSHLLSLNHLEKMGKDTELSLNINYIHDDIGSVGESESDIFVSQDQRLKLRQTMTAKSRRNSLDAQLNYMKNSEGIYISDKLAYQKKWDKDLSDISLTSNVGNNGSHIGQMFERPEFSVTNRLHIVNSIGEHAWSVNSSAAYAQKPNTLDVENDTARYVQDIMSRCITANVSTGYSIYYDKFTLDYNIVGYMDMKNIESDFQGMMLNDNVNDLWYNIYELSVYQHYTYKTDRWFTSLDLPIRLESRTLDDNIIGDRDSYTHLFLSPRFDLYYERRNLTLGAGTSYYKNVGDYGSIYKGYIMTDYRTFQRSYMDKQAEQETMEAHVKMTYRNVLQSLFANANASISRRNNNLMYGYRYDGVTVSCEAIEQNTASDVLSLTGDISKGMDFWHTTFKAFANYRYGTSEQLIQGELFDARNRSCSFGGGFTITPAKWLNVVYSGGNSISRSFTSGHSESFVNVRSSSNKIAMNIYPTSLLTLTASVEDNYNNLTESDRHSWFSDVKVKYKWGRADLELELNNLFNQTVYSRVTYDDLDVHSSIWQLRPRNILMKVRLKLK